MDAVSSLHAPRAVTRVGWHITPMRLTMGLILLALTARLVDLGMRPLWLDEGYSAWFSSRTWHVLWTEVPRYEPHPPFYYSLLKLWRELLGNSAIAMRLFSVLLGVAAVPLIIAAANELERIRPTGRPLLRAGAAGFLAACSPTLVLLGQEARPYPLLIFAYALAIVGLLRLWREFAAGGPGGWSSWVMLAAGGELGLWAHGLGVLYAACLGVAVAPAWLKRATGPRLLRGVAAAALVILLYLPCLLMIMNRVGDWGTGWLIWKPVMLLQLASLYSVPFEVLTVCSAVAALVLVLLTKRVIQAAFASTGWTAERALLLLWWGPPIIAVAVSQLAIPIFLPRTLAATLVPAYLALSGAIARSNSSRERLALMAALVITLTPSTVQMAMRPPTEQWDQVAAYLTMHVRPGDEVWLYPNDSALPLRAAGTTTPMHGVPGDYPAVGFKGPIRAGSPAVVSLTAVQAGAVANASGARNAGTIWLVTRQSGIFDPAGALPAALARVRRAGPMQEWNYINVQPYYRR